MDPWSVLLACALGSLGLYLAVRPGGVATARSRSMQAIGALLGLAALGWLISRVGIALDLSGSNGWPQPFYVIFSAIAIVCGVKLITTNRPVYAALYFVLVVLASAGLFLLLEAEFMAFALIIVYAGAILITYMFVLMLAQQSPSPDDPAGQPEYDLHPREPAAGVIVGFVLLTLFSWMILDGIGPLAPRTTNAQARLESWQQLAYMPGRIEEIIESELDADIEVLMEDDAAVLGIGDDGATVVAYYTDEGAVSPIAFPLPESASPENVQLVGLALVRKFPVSLELAGIILLMAMFGAAILARRQIELVEDEKREAAGMRRLGYHDDPGSEGSH